MYQALYRKWRPKTFSDVIGQSHITGTLQKQVAEGRTSHAYLFTGTRGTGKTTCAKILAKAVNCEHPEDGNPCCRCPSCLGIENGSFLDVLELDAASNNGVDQVRALRDEAIYAPANVKKRVYIIDEVHMLSLSAFNALLKILEEPPEHLMFILATTELHKVPATILSRCQRFSFKRISPADIAARLQYVAGQEQIALTPDGAELLSRLAGGALAGGLSLLDQCAAAGGAVDAKAVLEVLGLAGNLQTAKLMDCVARQDARAALLLLNQLYAGGKDVGAVLGELSTLTRDLLLRKIAPEGGAALLSGGYDSATLDGLERGLSSSRLLYLASTLQKASADLYDSSNRRTDAELCILRLCDASLSGDLTALSARIDRLEERMDLLPAAIHASAVPPASAAPASAVSDPPPWDEPPAAGDEPPIPGDEPPAPDGEPPAAGGEPPAPGGELPAAGGTAAASSPQDPDAAPPQTDAARKNSSDAAVWSELAESCKGSLPAMYRAFLDMCRGTVENSLVTVYAPDDITKNRLNNDRVLAALKAAGEKLTGAPVQLRLLAGADSGITQASRRKDLLAFGSQFDSVKIK